MTGLLVGRTPATAVPILELAAALGLAPDEVEPYGRHAAKIGLVALERRRDAPDGRLVCVTSMTPTPHGEGKTTTAIGLADALARIGGRPLLCLREPSMGPLFGIKGGGTGGGHAQLFAGDLINLHFTGDIHAVAAATNLLAAMIDAHVSHGNPLGIDPGSVTWRRCLDVEDRGLRSIVVAGHETGFDIAAASEVMAILSVARDLPDLRRRLAAITVGADAAGDPVTAEKLGAAGAMTALLVRALDPNLVQTLEGTPALVHCGPFANIALGNNSLVADLLGLKLADHVVTESGFGAEMGFEKLADIVCRGTGIAPGAVVVVATVAALAHHGGEDGSGSSRMSAIERGAENLAANLALVRRLGFEPVVAVNRFATDGHAELDAARRLALDAGAVAAEVCDGFALGGEGALVLAEAVAAAAADPPPLRPLYRLDEPIAAKLEAIAQGAYGAAAVELSPEAREQADRLEAAGLGGLPVCVAKTHLSLSHHPALLGAPRGYTLPVRELRAYTGAGWIVALCGQIWTMPGLPADPAALAIDVDAAGRVVGLR